jgi:hypothetical protein
MWRRAPSTSVQQDHRVQRSADMGRQRASIEMEAATTCNGTSSRACRGNTTTRHRSFQPRALRRGAAAVLVLTCARRSDSLRCIVAVRSWGTAFDGEPPHRPDRTDRLDRGRVDIRRVAAVRNAGPASPTLAIPSRATSRPARRRRLSGDRTVARLRRSADAALPHRPAQRNLLSARAGGDRRNAGRLSEQRQHVPQRLLAVESEAVRSWTLRKGRSQTVRFEHPGSSGCSATSTRT